MAVLSFMTMVLLLAGHGAAQVPAGSVSCGNGNYCPAGNACLLGGQCAPRIGMLPGSSRTSSGGWCPPGLRENRFAAGKCIPNASTECAGGMGSCPAGTRCGDNGKCYGGPPPTGPACGAARCSAGETCASTNLCIDPRSQLDCGNGVICSKGSACRYPNGCATVGLQRTLQTSAARGTTVPPQAAAPPPLPASDALVASIQTLLAALGYDPGPPDGSVGPRTTAAISSFQQTAGETPDGRPSEALRLRLQSALASRGPGGAPVPKRPDEPARKEAPPVGPATGPPGPTFDDAEAQLRIRQAASAVSAAAGEVDELRKALEAERKRTLLTSEERDLNRETIATLEKNLHAAEARQRDRDAALREAQEARRRGLSGDTERPPPATR